MVIKELKILLIILAVTASVVVPTSVYARPSQYPKFVTVIPHPTLKLRVPYHRQEHALSCEAAGLRMLLLARGVDEPENYIIKKMPVGPMHSDPDQVFVGNIDGQQFVNGYGIHPLGLLPIANTYFPAEAFTHQNLEFLMDRLHDGNPVLIWGSAVRNPRDRSWVTPQGKYVHAVAAEHVMVVTGYAGPRSAPTHFFVSDPIYGEKVFQTGTFLEIWRQYDNSGLFFK